MKYDYSPIYSNTDKFIDKELVFLICMYTNSKHNILCMYGGDGYAFAAVLIHRSISLITENLTLFALAYGCWWISLGQIIVLSHSQLLRIIVTIYFNDRPHVPEFNPDKRVLARQA